MRLSTSDGSSFELAITGYAYPQSPGRRYSEDWLDVCVAIDDLGRVWNRCSPRLLTDELPTLLNWITQVAAGDRSDPSIGFCEPNLRFELRQGIGGDEILIAILSQEFLPPWAYAKPWHSYELYFPAREVDFDVAINQLQLSILRFPVRPVR